MRTEVVGLADGETSERVTPNVIAHNLANEKATCTMSWCLNFCYSVMNPPFRYTCYGDYCICEKL